MWSPFPVLASSKTRHVNAGPPIRNNVNRNTSGTAFSQLAPTYTYGTGLRVSPNAIGSQYAAHYYTLVERRYQLARPAWDSRTTALEGYTSAKTFISDTSNTIGRVGDWVQGDLLTDNSRAVPVDNNFGCEPANETNGNVAHQNPFLGTILASLGPLSFVHRPETLCTGVLEWSYTLSHFLVDVNPTPRAWITPLDLLLKSSGYIPRSASTMARGFGAVSVTKVGCVGRSSRGTSWICLAKVLIILDPRNHAHHHCSCFSNRVADLSVVVEPASPTFRYYYPFQYLPFEPASLAPARVSSIAKPSVESRRLPITLPLAGVVALCFAARLSSPKFRSVLALGSTYGFAFARDPSTTARSSGFNHASNPSRAPGEIYPATADEFNMWSGLGQNLEPSYGEMWQGGTSQQRASQLHQGLPTSYSTPPCDHSDVLVPYHNPSMNRSIPPNSYGLHSSGSSQTIVSGANRRNPRPLPTPARMVDDREDPRRDVILAWSTHGRQQLNVSSHGGSINLPRHVSNGSSLPLNTLGHSMNLSSAVGLSQGIHPRHVDFSLVNQLEVSGSGVATGSAMVDQGLATEQGQKDWEPAVNEGHLAPDGSLPTRAANLASASYLVIPPHQGLAPVPPESARASEPRQTPHMHICTLCLRPFRRPYLLRDHMTSRHNQRGDGNSYVCDFPDCGLSYSSQSNLRRHSTRKHPEIHTTPIPGWAELSMEPTAHTITNSHSSAPAQRPRQVSVVTPVGGSTLAGEVVYVQAPASGPSNLSEADSLLIEQICGGADSEPPSGLRKFARGRKQRSNACHSGSLKHT